MKPVALTIRRAGPVPDAAKNFGEKIIQRIHSATGSNVSKATFMADADDELVARAKNGEVSAFEDLVRKYQTMIHALNYRMTGSLADAEDLAQETFIRAYHQLAAYNGASKFSTWLYSIAMHACLNWRRDEARRNRAQFNCAEEEAIHRINGEPPLPQPEKSIQIQAALVKLPPKQRAAIVLTIYDGLNHAEAARILHCSETTVSWRLFAAKRKLKRLLTAAGSRP